MKRLLINYKDRGKDYSNVVLIALIVILTLLTAFFLWSSTFYKVYVIGPSMESTLIGAESGTEAGGHFVYANRYETPKRGDIIIINTGNKTLIKRLIALGGDVVEIKRGVVYLNDKALLEDYVLEINNLEKADFPQITVPNGYMFCLGDNRDDSNDSRSEEYGCMPVSWTEGVVAEWSIKNKKFLTSLNTFLEFTLPSAFSGGK